MFKTITNMQTCFRMIDDWRSAWKSNLPFYYAQIAPYIYDENHNSQALREAQRKTLKNTEKTGMAVLLDIGEMLDIHPENKKDVGESSPSRFKNEYAMDIVADGPLYREHISRNNYIEVVFDHSDNGLVASGDLNGFEVAGADGLFHPAQAPSSKIGQDRFKSGFKTHTRSIWMEKLVCKYSF